MSDSIKASADKFAAMRPRDDAPKSFFYDGSRYYLDTGKEFVPMDQRSVTRHLKRWGITKDDADEVLCRIQLEQLVAHAGPLAGYKRGIHQESGCKLLATVSPSIIQPKVGTWPTLRAFLHGLLGNDLDADDMQVEVLLGWLKFARESLVRGKRRPGQALALAGPPCCGKSLLIDIIELALGGRRANPYPHFSGRTQFNGDLAGAELLAVDDEAGSRDIRARQNLAASIKASLFSGSVRVEGKYRGGFMFRPCWRMVLALNDEPESLLVLPPLTEDIADKLTLLRCHRRPLPMPAHTVEEREEFFATLKSELPGMLHAIDAWKVPETLREDRCGIIHFHHPSIEAQLGELSPEGQMLALVDGLADSGLLPLPWDGTAAEMKSLLMTSPSTERDAKALLGNWASAAGVFLGRLQGARVDKLPLRDGIQRWRINPRPSGAVEQVCSPLYTREEPPNTESKSA